MYIQFNNSRHTCEEEPRIDRPTGRARHTGFDSFDVLFDSSSDAFESPLSPRAPRLRLID